MKLLLTFKTITVKPSRSRALLRFSSCLLLAYMACGAAISAQRQETDAAATELRRGKLLYNKKDFVGAIASCSKAIELRPDWAVPYVQRGYVWRMQGDLDKAIKDYDKATELDPASTRNDLSVAEAYVNRGFIRMNALQIDEALADDDTAVKLYPKRTRTYLQRGQARILNEDFTGAIADFDYFTANEKSDLFGQAFAYADRAIAKHLLGKNVDADADMNESLKLMKGNEEVIHQHIKELAQQLAILRRLRPQKPKMVA